MRYGKDSEGYYQFYNIRVPGTGSNFENNDTNVVETLYVYNNQQKLPENLCSSDMVSIISSGSYDNFRRDMRPISYIYSLEKSYYQNISQEMLNMFASIIAFNNIIGEPVQKFRQEYKSLNKLRNLFFEKMINVPDIERYVDMYRWIDKSITDLIMDIIPASTNIIEDNDFVVESHLLERSKYREKFTNYRNKLPHFLENIRGIGASNYSWDYMSSSYYTYKWERSSDRIPVESSSLYYQNYNNIYDISLESNYKDNTTRLENGKTISYLDLEFGSKSSPPLPPSPGISWEDVGTIDYWDIYSSQYTSLAQNIEIPMPQLIGDYAGTVITGSRTSYSGSYYGAAYSEASLYPRSAEMDSRPWVTRTKNSTSLVSVHYRVNGINPLSGSSDWSFYSVINIPASVTTYFNFFCAVRGFDDGYSTAPRGWTVLLNNSAEYIQHSATTTNGSVHTFLNADTDLLNVDNCPMIFVMIKSGLSVKYYLVNQATFYTANAANAPEEIWPASNNLNILSTGTSSTANRSLNSAFSWLSLHDKAHSISEINYVISQINSKQNWSFVSVS